MWHLFEVLSYDAGVLISSEEQIIPTRPTLSQFNSFYHSASCGCNRNQTLASLREKESVENNLNLDWCGPESTSRGAHQKIVAFSIYGAADNDGSRYYNYIKDNADRIKDVLPGLYKYF